MLQVTVLVSVQTTWMHTVGPHCDV